MLKLTFEGATLAELKESIAETLAELGEGATPASVATKGTAKEKEPKAKVVKKVTTLEDVQNAIVASTAPKEKKKALLAEFSVAKASELEEAEYDDFISQLAAL
jgi:hypothetical protein